MTPLIQMMTLPEIRIVPLPGFGVRASMARLDEIHPFISGNKWFKLIEYVADASRCAGLITFGGPWSNHLHAAAYAAHSMRLPSIGVVRGDELPGSNPCLDDCRRWGMGLRFVPRNVYPNTDIPPGYLVIPEGGAGEGGIRGAMRIAPAIADWSRYSHILLATGTGTTLQGVDRTLLPHQNALGIVALQIPEGQRAAFGARLNLGPRSSLDYNFAFDGYARKNPEVFEGMARFHRRFGIPTDFVYTGKTVLALERLAGRGYFREGSDVLVLHTGGLQGNRSCAAELPWYTP